MDISTTTTLNNGIEMPLVGLGTFRSEDGEVVGNAVQWALDAGYRSIDTATMYQNESGIGAAVADSTVDRSDIFIATKVWNSDQGYDNTMASFEQSLNRLKIDYLDLFLIHWPSKTDMAGTWKAMEELYEGKAVRAIGVCNFMPHHLDQLTSLANVPPAINQVEHHPLLQQPDLLAACDAHDIRVTAWGPLVRGAINDIDTLVTICLLYTSPSPRDATLSRMPSSA